MFFRKPLDAITQEVVISLRDESARWVRKDMPPIARVDQCCLQRDDGLVVYERTSRVDGMTRAVAVFAGDGQFNATGADAKAMLKAVDAWRAWRHKESPNDIRRYLSEVR